MIKKVFSLYIFTIILINIIIINIKSMTANIIAIFLYMILIYILFRMYKKACIVSKINKYSISAIVKMFILSCILFISYSLLEYGYWSFFLPNYSITYEFETIHIINGLFFAPIAEEIIFRGILLNQMGEKHSFVIANVIQATIFSLIHFNMYTFFFLFVFSIMLGKLSKYSNIYYCILIHFLNNLLVILSVKLDIHQLEFSKYGYLIIGIIFSFVISWVLTYFKNIYFKCNKFV